MKMSKQMVKWASSVLAVLGIAVLTGCQSTFQSSSVKTSGFLGDYSQMTPGDDDQALLRYVNPKADIRKYDKIMIDPISFYGAEDSDIAKMDKEDRQKLANYLSATLQEHLKADYAIVDKPGPGVLRLRVALTDARGSRVVLDTISSVVPIGVALGAVKSVATGSNLSVGSASVECEGLDAATKERLFAAVDARIGRKYTGKFDKFNSWHAAQDAFDFWALRLQTRLVEQRASGN